MRQNICVNRMNIASTIGKKRMIALETKLVFNIINDRIAMVSHSLTQDDVVSIAEPHLSLTVIDVPGHTAGHIAYFVPEQHWLFCGDTLFAGGCGRLFEGTPKQMLSSLDKLAALPEDTLVYCAHEYTLSNLRFALEIEPDNLQLQQRMRAEQAKRQQGVATVPSRLALEKQTNPFLRAREVSVGQRLLALGKLNQDSDVVAVFTALREWKNHYI